MVFVTAAGLVIMSLAATPGLIDTFILAKEIAFRALALLALLLLTLDIAWNGPGRLREMARNKAVTVLVAATLVWTLVTTLVSTHRPWSVTSSIAVVFSVLFFLMVWYAAPWTPPAILDVLVILASIHTVIATLQELDIWEPFPLRLQRLHIGTTGLIGNPNLLGCYLALAAVIMAAMAITYRGWRSVFHGVGAVIALTGLAVSQTRTALIAAAAAFVLTAVWRSRKYGIAIAALVVLGFVAGWIAGFRPVIRLLEMPEQARQGRWDAVLSERFPSFLTAVEMFKDRPLTGLGPGTYKYHYMAYRVALYEQYPTGIVSGSPVNFAEAHNDHLQLLAEAGVFGYAIFLVALFVLGQGWRRLDPNAPMRLKLAHGIGFSLAVMTFVLCLAQFPLHVAATRHLLLTAAALAIGWRD